MGAIQFSLLGALEARVDGAAVPLGGARPQALLAALLLSANEPVSVDQLVDAVWGETPPASAQHALSEYVSRLRKALGDGHLSREGHGYVLRVPPEAIDARRFEALLERGRCQLERGRAKRAAETLREALTLWRGPALGDLAYEEFARTEAGRLEELRLNCLEARIDAELSLGRHEQLVPELQALAGDHPLRERLHAQLMLALYRCGRQAEALETYRRTRAELVKSLGIEPGPELRELEQAVLRQDPSLEDSSAPGVRGFLPAPLTSFVNRAREQAALLELLEREDVRLVTITGPGGIGKTRLALSAAAAARDDYPGGAWFVDLAPIADGALTEPTLAATLAATKSLPEHIGEERMLLVLDNFEHVLESAPLIVELLRACPQLEVLATSRERLRLSGEHVLDLDPLRPDEAIELFLVRGGAVRPSLAEDVTTVAICRRLEGLPLAIELAASRLAELTPEELLAVLEHRLSALVDGPRDASTRQQTIRATIEWSYELLTSTEQRAFRALSVFRSWTSEAANDVAASDRELLERLASKSLVSRRDSAVGTRFAMLETIREFGLDALEHAGEATTARARHASYMARLSDELADSARSGYATELSIIEAEHDNVLVALDHAIAVHDAALGECLVHGVWFYWVMRGFVAAGYRRVSALIAVHDGDVSPTLLVLAGELALCAGDLERARDLKKEAIKRFEGKPDPRWPPPRFGPATALTDLAHILIGLGELEEAEDVALRGMALRAELRDMRGIAHARVPLIRLELWRGSYERAAELAEESIPVWRQFEMWPDLMRELVNAATAHRLAGNLGRARSSLRQGLELAAWIGRGDVAADGLEEAALHAAAAGDERTAMLLIGAARGWRTSSGFVEVDLGLRRSGVQSIEDSFGADERSRLIDEARSVDLPTAIPLALAVID